VDGFLDVQVIFLYTALKYWLIWRWKHSWNGQK